MAFPILQGNDCKPEDVDNREDYKRSFGSLILINGHSGIRLGSIYPHTQDLPVYVGQFGFMI
ncbi:hypothetical protein [Haloferula sp.]|uniref:hypothetical protein n=1 Tax=Haloferula sp. TaxID=2497595 RepID=UPI00329F62C7